MRALKLSEGTWFEKHWSRTCCPPPRPGLLGSIPSFWWFFSLLMQMNFPEPSQVTALHPWKLVLSDFLSSSSFFFNWCELFLKSLQNLLQYCFCFMFWVFGCEACGILAPWPGIKPAPPALEDEVSTAGPPGESLGDLSGVLKQLDKNMRGRQGLTVKAETWNHQLRPLWRQPWLVQMSSRSKSKALQASLLAQLVKNPPAMPETPVRFLGWEDPLEKG